MCAGTSTQFCDTKPYTHRIRYYDMIVYAAPTSYTPKHRIVLKYSHGNIKRLLIVIASVIPMLIIASFLDTDAQKHLRTYPRRVQSYWISMITLVLLGELLALICIERGGANWWQGAVIWTSVVSVMVYIHTIALWRIRGTSLSAYSGLDLADKQMPWMRKKKK